MLVNNAGRETAYDYPAGGGPAVARPVTPTLLLTDHDRQTLGPGLAGMPEAILSMPVEQLMAKFGVKPYSPVVTNVPDPLLPLNLQREDEARKALASAYGHQVQALGHYLGSKEQAAAHLLAQTETMAHEPMRLLMQMIGAGLVQGNVNLDILPKLYETVKAMDAQTKHRGAVAVAGAARTVEDELKDLKKKQQETLSPDELKALVDKFHTEGKRLDAPVLGEELQGSPVLAKNLPNLMATLGRRTMPGGVPMMQQDVGNEIVRLAQAGGLMPDLMDVSGPVKLPHNWEIVFGGTPTLRGPGFEVPLGTGFTDVWRGCRKSCVRERRRCMPDHLLRFKGNRPSNRRAKWFSACFQPMIGIVHFFDALAIARYVSFTALSAEGYSFRFRVYFRIALLTLSIALVV